MLETNANIVMKVPGPLSKKLQKQKEKYVSDALHSTTNIFIQEAEGALIKDVDGNVYLDFAAISTSVGYCTAEIKKAIDQQMEKYVHASFLTVPYEPYVKLAERLSKLSPIKDAKVLLTNSGQYALMDAIQIAKHGTGKSGIAVMETSDMLEMQEQYYTLPCPRERESKEEVERAFCKMVKESQGIACVVIEPVQIYKCFLPVPKWYIEKVKELCERFHILFIMDESQTGIARTGTLFATEQFDIEPDLIVLSRSLATGIPIGGVIGKSRWMSGSGCSLYSEKGMGGNPLSCQVALTVLDNMEQYQLQLRSRALGEYIMSYLSKVKKRCSCMGKVQGIGSLVAIEFVQDNGEPNVEIVPKIEEECLKRGVILYQPKEKTNWIQLFPSLVMTMEQVCYGMQMLEQVILQLTENAEVQKSKYAI